MLFSLFIIDPKSTGFFGPRYFPLPSVKFDPDNLRIETILSSTKYANLKT